VFKREFEIAQRININLGKGLSPAEAVEAAKAAQKDANVEQRDPDETTEEKEKNTNDQGKKEEENKDDA